MSSIQNTHIKKSLLASAVYLALAGHAFAQQSESVATTAVNSDTVDEAKSNESSDPKTIDNVVVVGKRASVLKAISSKENSEIVSDSIHAEDLGRFPDANVADSLQHIPGVSVARTHGGEGQFVSVRGLGAGYSIVTLNDRLMATDNDGRDFAFDVLPSEIISQADILKSAQAKEVEGSIGGTIALRSSRPFDYKDGFNSVSVQGDFNDLSKDNGYKFGGVFSRVFNDGNMGFLLGLTYSDGKVRSDSLGEMYFNGDDSFDADKDGNISADETGLVTPCCYSNGTFIEQKKRTGLTAAFQWRPSDRLEMVFDGMYTKLDSPAVGYMMSYYIDHTLDDQSIATNWDDVVIDSSGVVTSVTVHDLVPELVTRNEDRVVDTYQLGWNTKYLASDNLTLTSDLYWSMSERNSGGKNTWLVAGAYNDRGTGYFSLNANGLPNMHIDLPSGRTLDQLTDADLGVHYAGFYGDDLKDEIFGGKIDGELIIDKGGWSKLRFGINYTDRQKTRTTIDNSITGGDCQYCGYPFTFAEAGESVVVPSNVGNLLNGVKGDFQRKFPSFNVDAYLRALKSADGKTFIVNGVPTTFDSSLSVPVFDPIQSYDIDETTWAGYAEMAFEADKWFGNVGIRMVNTHTNSQSAINDIISITKNGTDATSGYTVVYGLATPVSASGDYTKFLPSLNFNYRIQDDMLLRFAAAQVMTRPSLNQLAPTRTDNAINGEFIINYDGNTELLPTTANQADISFEWYYSPKSAVTAAVFWKDITNFVTAQTEYGVPIAGQLFDVTTPINGDSATVTGLELGLTHFFDNGFGFIANYTYTNADSYVDGVHFDALEGVSEQKYTLTFIYDNGPWTAQLSGDYNGKYIEGLYSALEGTSTTGESLLWGTASVSYEINDNMNVAFKAANIFDAHYRAYAGRSDLVTGFETWGRTYSLTYSYQF